MPKLVLPKFAVPAFLALACVLSPALALPASPQAANSAGSLHGTVLDSSGASVASAGVTLTNPAGGVPRKASSDSAGVYRLDDIPFGNWRLTVSATGFRDSVRDISIRSPEPAEMNISLALTVASASVDVTATADAGELTSAAHQTMDRSLLDRLPVQNPATGLSEAVTRSAPGVAADGNGFAHPLGEHADTSVSIDNQPITDQQAKIFSNQISASVVRTMEVITGAPPAEFGGKTSLLINVTTRSGLSAAKPFGSVSSQYGSFGAWSEGVTYGAGTRRVGNFVALDAGGSARFLDTPEFVPLHARGNAESLFDRFDWQPNDRDSFRLSLTGARSWFQTPNTFDSQAAGQDQRSQIRSFNVAPAWSRTFGPGALFAFHPFIRFDRSQYFPSANALSDLPATLSQSRYLTNAGFRGDISWSRGVHTAKLGSSYWHTLLRERFRIALTDPAWNAVCLDASGKALADPALVAPGQCPTEGARANPAFIPNLLPYDLTRGGRPYAFRGDADVEELAFYAQDSVTAGRLTLNPGLRYDRYNGLSKGRQFQSRFGAAYRVPRAGMVLRLSYARIFETPYNENLIVASEAGTSAQGVNPFGTFRSSPPKPGLRNQFNAGFAAKSGPVSFDGDYFWKFTKNAFDFDSLFLTPITFPIGWRKSKIDGLAARITLADIHAFPGFSAYAVLGHTRSRFFGPETGGLVFNNDPSDGVFRIDHSEEFGQTTFLRYQRGKTGPWAAFTWRYNSGLALPGVAPDYASALRLTGDEQAQAGLYCGNVSATRTSPLRSCDSTVFGATRVSIPPPGTENDDLRPTRVASRHIFDLGAGTDNLLHTGGYRMQLRFTVLNLANTAALYNFLSTFSGTHFVTPRTAQAEVRLVF